MVYVTVVGFVYPYVRTTLADNTLCIVVSSSIYIYGSSAGYYHRCGGLVHIEFDLYITEVSYWGNVDRLG